MSVRMEMMKTWVVGGIDSRVRRQLVAARLRRSARSG
jgi:hypothetical protein